MRHIDLQIWSTTDAPLTLIQYSFDSIEPGNSVFLFILWIEKKLLIALTMTFYTLSYTYIAYKGLTHDLLKAYLTGHSQKVRINDELSFVAF